MARRRRHNQGGGSQPRQRRFDLRRELLFRYDAENALRDAPLAEEDRKAFVQQLVTRGSRSGTEEVIDWVREKATEEGNLDERARDQIIRLLEKYSRYR